MFVSPTSPGISLPSIEKVAKPTGTENKSGFADLFSKIVADANSEQINADATVQQLATGETDSVHDVVLAMARADLAFRMIHEIRNQLIESYQEVMRMQV